MHLDADADAALKSCLHAIAVDPLCETAHVHLAHLHLQRNDLEAAIAAYDRGIALLRVKQELVDCYSMREAAAAQHKLLTEQAAIYAPVMEENRARMKEGMARMRCPRNGGARSGMAVRRAGVCPTDYWPIPAAFPRPPRRRPCRRLDD